MIDVESSFWTHHGSRTVNVIRGTKSGVVYVFPGNRTVCVSTSSGPDEVWARDGEAGVPVEDGPVDPPPHAPARSSTEIAAMAIRLGIRPRRPFMILLIRS